MAYSTLEIPLDGGCPIGEIAVGEDVAVTVRGGARHVGDGLRVRIRYHGKEIAMFPTDGIGESWSVDGDDATCSLNMRTTQGFYAFARRPDISYIKCVLLVDCAGPGVNTLNVITDLPVNNWPVEPEGALQPLEIPQWESMMAGLSQLIGDLRGDYDEHGHTGGADGAVLEHGDLNGIGARTHDKIDEDIGDLEAGIVGLEQGLTAAEQRLDGLDERIESHGHTGGAQGQRLNHGDLNDIGTRTHAELESDIQAADLKADSAALAVLNHDHTGGASGTVLDIADLSGYTDLMNTLTAMTNRIAALETFRNVDVPRDYLPRPPSANYTVTAPSGGEYRNIRDDMTGDEMAACLPTIVQDLKDRGVL